VTPLTRAGFSPYGDVIDVDGARHFAINSGRATRFDDMAGVDTLEFGGAPAISIFRSAPIPLPVELHVMERHPLASQAIVPIDGVACLVVVAPAGDLDPALIRIFLASGKQGVNYRRGIWHHPLISLHRTGDFLVVDRKGPGENCDVIDLNPTLRVAAFLSQESTR
jgi:ureidoglycolate lyase